MSNPVVKWAGGKRQLLPEIQKRLPAQFNTYYEPFFGGGALYFALAPKKAVINDFNTQLMNVYRQIKAHPDKIIDLLLTLQNSYNAMSDDQHQTAYYLEQRNIFNQFIAENQLLPESAALFIFLNKAGYNGLYRVNKSGLFNVPSAHRKILNIFEAENIYQISKMLKHCRIKHCDFEKSCQMAQTGDFVFFDSPYYDTFDSYQACRFSEQDHLRLANLFQALSNKGVYCILTNNNCDFIKNLYQNYYIDILDVKRMINSDSNNRVGQEVIITNFR